MVNIISFIYELFELFDLFIYEYPSILENCYKLVLPFSLPNIHKGANGIIEVIANFHQQKPKRGSNPGYFDSKLNA